MDHQLIAIIVVFILLFVLEKYESYNKEEFIPIRLPGYTNWSPHLYPGYFETASSVNFAKKDKNFGNFGTFGSYPPMPLCESCEESVNCVAPPYQFVNNVGDETGEQHGSVCTMCRSINGKNYGDLNRPLLVAARTNGRPRDCRRLI